VVGTFKVVVRWSSTKPSGKLGRHGYMLPCSCDVSEGGCLGGLRRNLSIPEAKALIQSLGPISGTMSERLTSQSLTHGLGFRGVTFATGGGDDAGFRVCRGCIVALCMTGAQDLCRPSAQLGVCQWQRMGIRALILDCHCVFPFTVKNPHGRA
jgi:hypothetical protein